MLETINSVDWSNVTGAYGPATDVPELISGLAGKTFKRGALLSLSNIMNHQGLITPAAVEAAPFLVELAGETTVKDRAAIVALLGELATGGSHIRFVMHELPDKAGADPESPVGRIRQHVVKGLPAWAGLLEFGTEQERAATAFLLAMVPETAGHLLAVVRRRVEVERAEKPLASTLISLAVMNLLAKTTEDAAVLRGVATGKDGLPKLAALIGLALLQPGDISEDDQMELLDGLEKYSKQAKDLPWFEGELDNLVAVALTRAATHQGNMDVLSLLLDATKNKPTYASVARGILDVAFPDEGGRATQLRVPSDLTEVQRRVLKEVIDRDLVHPVSGALARHGLLSGPLNLKRFIGLTPPGPMDRAVDGEPLFRLCIDVMSDRKPESAWLDAMRALSPDEVIAASEDAAVPPYAVHLPWPYDADEGDAVYRERCMRFQRLLSKSLVERSSGPALEAAAARLLAASDRPERLCAVIACALSEALHKEGRVLDEKYDPIVAGGMGEEYWRSMREVLERLPVDRREKLILNLGFSHYEETVGAETTIIWRDAWLFADLCPTPRAVEQALEAVRAWEPDELAPEDQAVAVLQAIGSAAPDLVTKAAEADENPRARSVAERALKELRST